MSIRKLESLNRCIIPQHLRKQLKVQEDDYILYLRQNLRLLRKINDMTQREVAERIYIDRSSYSYYESGRIEPSYHTLVRISNVFHVSVDVLLLKDLKSHFQQELLSMQSHLS